MMPFLHKGLCFIIIINKEHFYYSGISISRTSRGNANWFEKLERSGVKLQCLTQERERLLVRVIGSVQETEGSRNRDSAV